MELHYHPVLNHHIHLMRAYRHKHEENDVDVSFVLVCFTTFFLFLFLFLFDFDVGPWLGVLVGFLRACVGARFVLFCLRFFCFWRFVVV